MLNALNEEQLMLLYKEAVLKRMRREYREQKKVGVTQLSNLLGSIKIKATRCPRARAHTHWPPSLYNRTRAQCMEN